MGNSYCKIKQKQDTVWKQYLREYDEAQRREEALKTIEILGYVPEEYAELFGVEPGTSWLVVRTYEQRRKLRAQRQNAEGEHWDPERPAVDGSADFSDREAFERTQPERTEDDAPEKAVDNSAVRGIMKRDKAQNRARAIKTYDDLNRVSTSRIIGMVSHAEIVEYFKREYGIVISGFEKKDLLSVKATLSGIDDMCREFSEPRKLIKSISYNSQLRSCGRITSNGVVQIGKSGLMDYGTGVHEAAHAIDYVRSGNGYTDYSELVIEQARKSLHLRKNSREYKDLAYLLTMNADDAKNHAELFAYAIESEKGLTSNDLSEAIYAIVKGGVK